MKTELQVDVKDIDHLGIIAGIIDEIGIVEIIDQEIGTHAQEKVSAGLVVKAMIINGSRFKPGNPSNALPQLHGVYNRAIILI